MANSGPVRGSRFLGSHRFPLAALVAAGVAAVVQVVPLPRPTVAAALGAVTAVAVLTWLRCRQRGRALHALREQLERQVAATERLVAEAVPAVLAGADPADAPGAATAPPVEPRLAAAHRALLSQLAEATRRQSARQEFGRRLMATVAGRLQARLHRVAAELQQVERARDGDPELREPLLRLTHGVRMSSRAALKLAVLGGGQPLRSSPRPVPLAEVLRASSVPLTEYARVERLPVPDVAVAGPVVEPLCAVLTELLDNATRFSPPGTTVTVSAARVGADLEIAVRDQGTGLTEEQHRRAELLLHGDEPAEPAWRGGTVRLGLRVVGLLAAQYDLRVRLVPAPGGDADGVTARVLVPAPWVTTRRRDQWATSLDAPGEPPAAPSQEPPHPAATAPPRPTERRSPLDAVPRPLPAPSVPAADRGRGVRVTAGETASGRGAHDVADPTAQERRSRAPVPGGPPHDAGGSQP
mgnify:CR=1 FL=1